MIDSVQSNDIRPDDVAIEDNFSLFGVHNLVTTSFTMEPFKHNRIKAMRITYIECGTCFKNYLNDRFHRILDILATFSFENIYTVYVRKRSFHAMMGY